MNFGHIIDRLQYLIDDDSAETLVDLERIINAKYFSIASEHIWQSLTLKVTGQGTVLPSDLQWVVYVEDDTDYLYFNRGIPQRYGSPTLYNYFMNLSQATPLLTLNDAVITVNSTAVTSVVGGFVSATHAGEYMRIGENLGLYKIASVTNTNTIVLSEAFRGASATAQHVEIRPASTRLIAFTDEDGAAITSSTMKMWYLRQPLPLYNTYDEILLPGTCEALIFAVLRELNLAAKYDNDALKLDASYILELNKMKALSKVPDRFNYPRGADGEQFKFGRRNSGDAESLHEYDTR